MRCSLCNRIALALEKEKSGVRVLVAEPEALENKALDCEYCKQVVCGQCALENTVSLGRGIKTPVCKNCGDAIGFGEIGVIIVDTRPLE